MFSTFDLGGSNKFSVFSLGMKGTLAYIKLILSITLISLDEIGILIAPVAKWVRCSTIGKLAQALRNFACAERREGIYCSSFAHLCLHPLVLMIVMACF